MQKNLGQRIRKLRKERGLTLVEVSAKTGFAQATLSRIETGTMMGTVECHEKVAEVLGIGLAELYSGVDKRYDQLSHLDQKATRKVTHHSNDVHTELLTSDPTQKKITPLLMTLEPNAETQTEKKERGVEIFLYALSGSFEVKVDSETINLLENETLYFDASLPHTIKNTSKQQAQIFIALSPSKI